MANTEVVVDHLPACDVCKSEGTTTTALYDGKTSHGPWAYMCDLHFAALGLGLGVGRGQRLVVRDEREVRSD